MTRRGRQKHFNFNTDVNANNSNSNQYLIKINLHTKNFVLLTKTFTTKNDALNVLNALNLAVMPSFKSTKEIYFHRINMVFGCY